MKNEDKPTLRGLLALRVLRVCLAAGLAALATAWPGPRPLHAKGMGTDYYSNTPEDRNQLYQVELHHFTEDNFWGNFQRGQYRFAVKDLEFILRWFPNHPDALAMMGQIAKLTRNVSLPIAHFEKAITLYPQYGMTWMLYGSYLLDIGLLDEAIEKLKKALELDPTLGIACARLAKAYERQGNAALAREYYRKAQELGFKEGGAAGPPGGKPEAGDPKPAKR